MDITLYHNPRCSKSRSTLELIRTAGFEPRIVDYLQSPLTSIQLRALTKQLQLPVRALLREGEEVYAELGLDDMTLSEDSLFDAIAKHPVLLARPIVVTPLGARLCRPPELVLELLQGNGLANR